MRALFLSLTFMIALASPALGYFSVYVSPSKIETAEASGITGVSTETFTNRTAGTSVNGFTSVLNGVTYTTTSGGNAQAAGRYGGYNSGTYLGVSANSQVTMSLDVPAQYFGFYFSAGDVNNLITLYSGNTLLASYSTATLIAMLPNNPTSTITAVNGLQYHTNTYYGQPTSNLNSAEAYAYLHFVADQDTTFDRIVLSQGSTAIFENDNHSIRATAPTLPGTLVLIGTVPEPSSLLLCGTALMIFVFRRRRR